MSESDDLTTVDALLENAHKQLGLALEASETGTDTEATLRWLVLAVEKLREERRDG